MKRELFILLFVGVFAFGCRTGMTTHDQPCYELSKSMRNEMVEYSRHILRNHSRAFRPDELHKIESEAPDQKFEYSGDYRGKAEITWNAGARTIGIYFEFNDEIERMAMIVKDNTSAVIDYTGGELTPEALKKVEKLNVDPEQGARIFGTPAD